MDYVPEIVMLHDCRKIFLCYVEYSRGHDDWIVILASSIVVEKNWCM